MTLIEQIAQEVKLYSEQVELEDGHYFNHRELIKRINLYQNNKFLECDDKNAVFWNIAAPLIPHFSKNIDLDTKNFYVAGVGEANSRQAWVMNVKFRRWAGDNGFALTLNDLSEGVSTYGTIVWKLVDDTEGRRIEECDFNNLYYDPLVKNINDSNIMEEHRLTEYEVKERFPKVNIEKFKKWAEPIGKAHKETGLKKYKVWEFCGYNDGNYVHKIVAGAGANEIVLHEFANADKKKPTYYDFHLHRYKGRHLRIGVYERLFDLQERCNTLVNQNAETTAIASLLLLKTTDPNTKGNVLSGAISGQIISTQDLEQVVLDNRGLSSFLQEMALIEAQALKLCMTPQVVTGETLPSHTPFRSMAALTNAAVSAFKDARDRLGYQIAYILEKEIFPDLVKSWNAGEVIEFAESDGDLRLIDQIVVETKYNAWLMGEKSKGRVPNEEERQRQKQIIQESWERGGRKLKIEKGFFNFKYGLKLNPTGEAEDKATKNDVYFNILQWIQTNPALQNNPYFKSYVEDNGIPSFRLTQEEIAQFQQTQTAFQPNRKKEDLMSAIKNPSGASA